jgi:hypothetical protein
MLPIGELLSILAPTLLVLFTYSFLLWKDNPTFRFTQFTLAAVAMANLTVFSVKTIMSTSVTPLIEQSKITYIIPIILGLLLYTRITEQYAYMSRWGMAIIVGVSLGLSTRGGVESQIIDQIQANILPLWGGKVTPLDNIIIILTTIFAVTYFFFTIRPKGSGGQAMDMSKKIGRYAIMMALGSIFGNMILSRMTWLTGRVGYIVDNIVTIIFS